MRLLPAHTADAKEMARALCNCLTAIGLCLDCRDPESEPPSLQQTQELMAKAMGAPEALWNKAPTADLEELNPGKLDDDGFGFPYDLLDDFLEGIAIPKEVEAKILARFEATRFKRRSIPGFGG